MLEVNDLVKVYGDHIAVDHLSFRVDDCQVFGFLGPNGAGKSTTMNIIAGALAPTSGSVSINGYDTMTQSKLARRCVGYLPEIPPLYGELTPKEYLRFVAEAKGIGKASLSKEVAEVMAQTKIENMQDRLIRNLSKGYKQRVGLAQAILGRPPLLILDEPTVGLDPQQIIDFRDLIKEYGKMSTVILSSHILSEISAVCSKVMIIRNGKLVTIGNSEELEARFSGSTGYTISVPYKDAQTAVSVIGRISTIDSCSCKQLGDSANIKVSFHSENAPESIQKISQALLDVKCPVLGMKADEADLEKVFLELTGRDVEEKDGQT